MNRSSLVHTAVPLSPAQREIWAADTADPRLRATCRLDIRGRLDRDSLNEAIRCALGEAVGIGASFDRVDDEPKQVLRAAEYWELPVVDLSAETDPVGCANNWVRRREQRSYDVTRGPLVDFVLLRLAADNWILYLGYHQLVLDVAGIGLLVARCAEVYAALVAGRPMPPGRFGSLSDYLARDAVDTGAGTAGPAPTRLLDDGGTTAPGLTGCSLRLSADDLARLGADWHDTVVAVLAVYLARMRDTDDVTVGVAVDGRDTPLARTVPTRTATVRPVRLRVARDATWARLRTQVRTPVGARGARPTGVLFPGPVVTVLPGRAELDFGGLVAVVRHRGNAPAADLALCCQPGDDGGMDIAVEAGPGCCVQSAAEDHRDRLAMLVAAAAADPDAVAYDADLLTDRDAERVLRTWNNTAVPLPNVTVPALFDSWVARTPDAVALDCDERTLSYAQLDAMVHRLARRLVARGVRPGDAVGVLMARSADLVVALLAVARTGAVYVPLDLRYPVARMRTILAGVGCGLLLVDGSTRDHDVTSAQPTMPVDGDGDGDESVEPLPDGTPSPDALLHIIHTSGSTGTPKGVAITHRNVVKLAADRIWQGGDGHRMLFHSPHAWDACTLEVLVPLLIGGRVVVLTEDVNVLVLRRLVGSGRVTALWLTAGLFGALAEGDPGCLAGAREVWTGGDTVSPRAVARVTTACPGTTVYNGYGPVETTVFATRHRIRPDLLAGDTVSIGTPMDNTRVYVLDEALRPLPPGAVGQLHVAGAGVGVGYAGRPDLTRERFRPDPFHPDGGRMYATGDLARWDENGTLRFVGRVDGQVKINGFRIEPGEIEAALAGHPDVAQAAVVVHKADDGSGRITACAVPAPGAAPTGTALREHLAAALPKYMVPGQVAVLAALPLTPNGKVDRARLRTLILADDNGSGPHMTSKAPIDEHPAVLSAPVDKRPAVLSAPIDKRPAVLSAPIDERPAVLSATQRHWLAAHRAAGPRPDHTVAGAVRLTGALDTGALRAAVADVLGRQPGLRTVFPDVDGAPVARVLDRDATAPVLDEMRSQPAQLPKVLADLGRRAFDIAAEPPVRVTLVTLGPQDHVLLLVLHRVIGDRASLAVVGDDLGAAYTARLAGHAPEWAPLPDADRDGEPTPDERAVRRPSTPDGPPTKLALPVDRPRPATPTHRAGTANFVVEPDLHRDLLALAEQTGTTLTVVLRAALAALLTRLGAGDDVPIGGTVPGRRGGAVGCVENTLVRRVDTSGDPTFVVLLDRVLALDTAAPLNQDAPVEPLAHQVLLSVAETAEPLVTLPGTHAEPQQVGIGHTLADLVFTCTGRQRSGLDGVVTFSRDLFDHGTVQDMADAFVRLLRTVVVRPTARLAELPRTGDTPAEPADAVRRGIADMWSDLLEVPVDSADASFWELGGHSLLGVTLTARIRERFGVRVPLRELFGHPRLGDLADIIVAATTTASARPAGERLPASSFQQRIWLAEKLRPEHGLYNVPLSWRLSGPLAPDRLAAALATVVRRHEALRTTFVEHDGQLCQVVGTPWQPVVWTDTSADDATLAELLRAEADRPFDLAAGPLLRAGLVDTPDGQVLTITVHHIVFDMTSVTLLLAELDRYYTEEGGEDGPARRQYREVVAATEQVDPAGLRRRVERLRGAPSRLRTTAPKTVDANGVVPLDLPTDLLRRVRTMQDRLGMSWFMVAAAALAGGLHRWTGAQDVTFGFPTDTRSGGEFADVIGPCLNTVAVRSGCGQHTTVAALLADIRDDVLAALDDQHVPFDAIVDALNPPRTADSTPYLDVVLAPQVAAATLPSVGGRGLRPLELARGTTGSVGKFAVSVSLTVAGDTMSGALLYRGDRLSASAAAELAGEFTGMFQTLLGDGDALVAPAPPTAPEPVVTPRRATPAAPSGAVERRVAAIWSALLGGAELGVHDNFFDVGGNSLKLVTLHAELCREFAVELPIQRLFENATIWSLARYLDQPEATSARPAGPDAAARGAARRDLRQRRAGTR